MVNRFITWLRGLFNLDAYKTREDEVIESIRNNVEFRGTNLWILIFAIIIASVGLNVNSTAVVIGAMLISPLMGPIIGIGLGVGIYDFQLIKKSARNLAVAVVISVLTAAIYFFITPIKDAHSELLARTTPTIWDVFIAFAGGMAAIIAINSKEKGNVIPGAAIATALIPPLCTAGYGVATGNLSYFIGAFYLFLINTVFICLATILIVRYLRFPVFSFVNDQTAKKVKRSITWVAVITIIPSIVLATRLVLKNIYENKVNTYVEKEFHLPNTIVVDQETDYLNKKITLFLIGDRLDSTDIKRLSFKLSDYGLGETELAIKQGQEQTEQIGFDTELMEDMLRRNRQELDEKNEELRKLQSENKLLLESLLPANEVLEEMQAQNYPVLAISLSRNRLIGIEGDTVCLAFLKLNKELAKEEKTKLERWLKVRTKSAEIRVLYEISQ
ncbi:MAG: DUF389 domain-containing protein [Bacteroidetes bacterium]|nr:MAG: DUF389 domain-containing protein [Bacteroidota bacterium]